ncbi:MAG: thioredoxin domain-containing protein [Anaerolineae bacterium]|nr:thioredoxin domain-containing protein [Anaerolineae bacterium]
MAGTLITRLARWVVSCALLLAALGLEAQQFDPYANIPQSQGLEGFPQLGYPSALVNVIIYGAFDDPATAEFWVGAYRGLLPRVQTGEIRLVFVPLISGGIPGGQLAARSAICAGEQGKFWQYAEHLFPLVLGQGAEAYAGDVLDSAARDVGLDLGQYQRCASGNTGFAAILEDAEQSAARDAFFTSTPYVKVNESPSLPDAESLIFAIDVQLEAANADLIAELTTPTPDPEATEEAEPLVLEAVTGQDVPPPITLQLPAGWLSGSDVLVLQDVDAIRNIPFAIYTGPVTGGVGTIVLLWGFPNLVVAPSAVQATLPPEMLDLHIDGTRLLRLAVVEQGCNVGTDLRRTYSIGGLQAAGTQFAAVDCPELPDTRGWFAGLRQYGLNFMFYAYAEPIEAMDTAEVELQAILDTVVFTLPETD